MVKYSIVFASLVALVAASPINNNKFITDAVLEPRRSQVKGWVTYCDKNGHNCGKVPVSGQCMSSKPGAPLLYFDKNLRCDVWGPQGCPALSGRVVRGVRVAFNTATNPLAGEQNIPLVGSFRC